MSSAQCPQCARPLATGSDQYCPSCGFALSWNERTADGDGETDSDLQRVPADKDDEATSPGSPPPKVETPRPQPPAPTLVVAPPPPSFACPACLEPNPETRLLCQRCGALLEPEQEPLPPSWSPGAPWRWRGPLILLGVAAVGAMAAVVLAAALRSDGRLSPPAPPTGAAAAPSPVQAAPAAVEVDPRSISASASSELPPADSVTYSIRNTLDGNSRTAWNNHSAVAGS